MRRNSLYSTLQKLSFQKLIQKINFLAILNLQNSKFSKQQQKCVKAINGVLLIQKVEESFQLKKFMLHANHKELILKMMIQNLRMVILSMISREILKFWEIFLRIQPMIHLNFSKEHTLYRHSPEYYMKLIGNLFQNLLRQHSLRILLKTHPLKVYIQLEF